MENEKRIKTSQDSTLDRSIFDNEFNSWIQNYRSVTKRLQNK